MSITAEILSRDSVSTAARFTSTGYAAAANKGISQTFSVGGHHFHLEGIHGGNCCLVNNHKDHSVVVNIDFGAKSCQDQLIPGGGRYTLGRASTTLWDTLHLTGDALDLTVTLRQKPGAAEVVAELSHKMTKIIQKQEKMESENHEKLERMESENQEKLAKMTKIIQNQEEMEARVVEVMEQMGQMAAGRERARL